MTLTCPLCFRHCQLEEGQLGFCRARANRGGRLVPLCYGKLAAVGLDPIEKKPLRRFHPGSRVLSVGGFGCNLRCPYCQNASISMVQQEPVWTEPMSPEALVSLAARLRPRGNIGLAFTYNEPLVGYEFVRDCAVLTHQAGMVNVLVTNGTICPEPWQALLPHLDAVNIDLKGFTQDWYRELGGDLETVKQSIILAHSCCHVEVTTLLVPGKNDSSEEIHALATWLSCLSPDIPLHLSRFFPRYRMANAEATPVETVYARAEEARKVLRYVYTGNC